MFVSTVSPEGSVTVSQPGISNLGDNVTLSCSARGGPNNSFQWALDGEIIPVNDSVLHLVNIDASNGGDYTCTVSNAAGGDSAFTTLYVAPYIVNPLEEEILSSNGSKVNMTCDADGFPAPNVTWVDMMGGIVSDAPLLVFDPVQFGDEGVYQCKASVNIDGTNLTASDETTLTGENNSQQT